MIDIITYIIIGIGLSIDAFIVSISYGTVISKYKEKILLVFTIGILHFIMPLLGSVIANIIDDILIINTKYIVIAIFIVLLIGMLKNDNQSIINIASMLSIFLLGIAVSMDSLSVGIALTLSESKIIPAALTFSIISTIITFFGIKISSYITQKYNNRAKILGIILILIVILKYLICTS